MSMTIRVDDELAAQLEETASGRQLSAEDLAVQLLGWIDQHSSRSERDSSIG